MNPIIWSSKYSVGVAAIDNQHKRLLELLSDFQAAMARGAGADALGGILDELIRYTVSHFADEEQLMRSVRYPDYAAHKAEHDRLVARVREFQARVAGHRATLSIDVLHFLWDWLKRHIMESDKSIGRHMDAAGRGTAMKAG